MSAPAQGIKRYQHSNTLSCIDTQDKVEALTNDFIPPFFSFKSLLELDRIRRTYPLCHTIPPTSGKSKQEAHIETENPPQC